MRFFGLKRMLNVKAISIVFSLSLLVAISVNTAYERSEIEFGLFKIKQLLTANQLNNSDDENSLQTTIVKRFESPQIIPPEGFIVETVSTVSELNDAVKKAHSNGGKTAIYLRNGIYNVRNTIRIRVNDIMFLSLSGNPYLVTIQGIGMKRTRHVNNIFEVRASGFVLDGIRLTDAPNHLLQIAAENNASRPIIRNCILQDSFEQLLKVSYDQESRPKNVSRYGIVEHCIFQYTRGIAPYYYTGGIDALGAKGWRVENNIFKDIASPAKKIAQHAVHFWVNSSDNIVTNNIFIDNDRAIGFGMKLRKRQNNTLDYFNKGGEITSNLVYHSNNGDPFADTGIVLEASPDSLIANNYILLEHSYPRAIEYRFEQTQNVVITNNYTNKSIRSRDGGTASLTNNSKSLDPDVFFKELVQRMEAQHILHLAKPITGDLKHD